MASLKFYSKYFLLSIVTSLLSTCIGETLYGNCGGMGVLCLGAKNNVKSEFRKGSFSSGCIADRDCQTFLMVRKVGDDDYKWTIAFEASDSFNSVHHVNNVFLIISRNAMPKLGIPTYEPYFRINRRNPRDPRSSYEAKTAIVTCGGTECREDLAIPARSQFIKFATLSDQIFSDSTVRYKSTTGTSKQLLHLTFTPEVHGSKEFFYDLINDKLTIILLHWYGKTSTDDFFHHAGNFGPVNLDENLVDVTTKEVTLATLPPFTLSTPTPPPFTLSTSTPVTEYTEITENTVNPVPSHTTQTEWTIQTGETVKTRDPMEAERKGKKRLLWLWILIGVIGIILIVFLITLAICCYYRNKKAKNEQSQPKRGTSKRLDYIAHLAGYEKGKPVYGEKKTTVKEHDFNKGFSSVSHVNKRY